MSIEHTKGKDKILKRADPSTIQDKFMVGYQGWFTCAGDGEPVGPGHHGWLHWFDCPIPDGGHPNTDLWPDVSSYSPSELFPAPGLKTRSGEQVFLFSSRHPKTVQRHFHWMAEHGIDGAFLQRFVSQCDIETGNEGIRRIRDEVGDRVREAAEKEGRAFAIMYDVSGMAPDRIQRVLERDWVHLIREKCVLDSPNYLREKGKPVVALWGFGFENAGHTPDLVKTVINYIRDVTPGGVYIMAGTPAHWRTAESDADRNPGFLDVWLNEFDAISPWTVGRYRTEQDADDFAETKMKGDIELIRKRNEEGRWRKIDYIPVVLPGGSGYNLSEGKWGYNDIKRKGGRFLWNQISNAKRQGARTIYGAMWDEYDEGTAFLPVVESKRLLPASDTYPFMALDEDGYDLPSDWYMRICGFAGEGLRGERRIRDTFPYKELQDYWSTRPKYEDIGLKSGDFVSGSSKGSGGSGEGSGGQSYQDWLATQKTEDKEEPPPPPYSLEADESTDSSPQPTVQVQPGPAETVPNIDLPAISAPTLAPASVSQQESPVSVGPPPINPNSRPQRLQNQAIDYSHSTSETQQPYGSPMAGAPARHDPVSSLADDFGRQTISGPGGAGHMAQTSYPMTSPPPLHPAHPAASSLPYHQPRPQSPHSRPQSQSGYRPTPSPNTTPISPPSNQQSGPWSQGQWPPPEWGVAAGPQPPPAQLSSYPGQVSSGQSYGGGANLSRPHTMTASSYNSASELRPHALVSGSSSRPQYQSSLDHEQGNTGASFPGSSPYQPPQPSTASSYFGNPEQSTYSPGVLTHMPPTLLPTSSVSYMSSYSGQNISTYPGQSGYISSSVPAHNPPTFGHSSPPHMPGVGQSYGGSPSPGQSYEPYAYYSGQSYPGSSLHIHSPSTPDAAGGFQFPQVQAGGQFNLPQPQPQQPSYATSYLGQESPYPVPSAAAGSGWYPGRSDSSTAPSLPPRPPIHASSQSGLSFPTASPSPLGAGAFGAALNAVDKVAGRKTRVQLESGVGALAQTGSKLFNKFAK